MFPMAAITNSHTLTGLKLLKLIILPCWRLEIQSGFHWAKIAVLAGLVLSAARRGESISLSFPVPRGYPHSLPCGPKSRWPLLPSTHLLLCLCLSCFLVHLLGSCDFIGPIWIIEDYFPISKSLISPAKFLLPYEVTYLQAQWLGRGHLWEPMFCLLLTWNH